MLSSVSSKCVFLQGEITISKHHSCLKADIVEGLQCVKCMIQHDLLFQEPAPSLIVEVEETGNQGLDDMGAGGDLGKLREELDVKDFLWDGLLIDDKDEEPIHYMYYSE